MYNVENVIKQIETSNSLTNSQTSEIQIENKQKIQIFKRDLEKYKKMFNKTDSDFEFKDDKLLEHMHELVQQISKNIVYDNGLMYKK